MSWKHLCESESNHTYRWTLYSVPKYSFGKHPLNIKRCTTHHQLFYFKQLYYFFLIFHPRLCMKDARKKGLFDWIPLTLPVQVLLLSLYRHKIHSRTHVFLQINILFMCGFCNQRFFKQSFPLQILMCFLLLLLFLKHQLLLLYKQFTKFSFICNIKFLSHDSTGTLSIYFHRSGLMALRGEWYKNKIWT